jgi:hypothetical protein|eukprot:CAMPEP_0169376128 /NCGR_PEP_ID=MMETSP1017-20121227/38488_1 /TAXON_ID=342587 /ORGANISM="Karlodinium micrum, Strain CCMP2283" /LENGTH=60 /DNA_ID=CAMNT_0009475117 /DNA_START=658 /DNA_END=840 /DNA_ORIENTATION=+
MGGGIIEVAGGIGAAIVKAGLIGAVDRRSRVNTRGVVRDGPGMITGAACVDPISGEEVTN